MLARALDRAAGDASRFFTTIARLAPPALFSVSTPLLLELFAGFLAAGLALWFVLLSRAPQPREALAEGSSPGLAAGLDRSAVRRLISGYFLPEGPLANTALLLLRRPEGLRVALLAKPCEGLLVGKGLLPGKVGLCNASTVAAERALRNGVSGELLRLLLVLLLLRALRGVDHVLSIGAEILINVQFAGSNCPSPASHKAPGLIKIPLTHTSGAARRINTGPLCRVNPSDKLPAVLLERLRRGGFCPRIDGVISSKNLFRNLYRRG